MYGVCWLGAGTAFKMLARHRQGAQRAGQDPEQLMTLHWR